MQVRQKVSLVFLLDVDNTLIDNDRAKRDMQGQLLQLLGKEGSDRFWALYEEVRKELDVVDFPETLRRFATNWKDKVVAEKAQGLLDSWPYKGYLYPGAIATLEYLSDFGEVAILSDGDTEFQPRKIASAGITEAVGGPADVLIYTHKETCFEDVMERLPSDHYVLIDDKEKILAGAKEVMKDKLTTIWVKQGHYASDPAFYRKPDPDVAVDSIGEISSLGKQSFLE
ncbi:MAG: HAD family hydrolase [Chloroflexota bacterium]|nr:HAD family hydrolase [Chloroflexota bacterium]